MTGPRANPTASRPRDQRCDTSRSCANFPPGRSQGEPPGDLCRPLNISHTARIGGMRRQMRSVPTQCGQDHQQGVCCYFRPEPALGFPTATACTALDRPLPCSGTVPCEPIPVALVHPGERGLTGHCFHAAGEGDPTLPPYRSSSSTHTYRLWPRSYSPVQRWNAPELLDSPAPSAEAVPGISCRRRT